MTGPLPARALVILTAAVAYGASVDNYFVQDDFGVVWLLSRKPAGYFPRWFVTSWMDTIWGHTPDEVRPFVAMTYQLAALPGPASPVANHVINIAFHAATALLVFGVAQHAARLGTAGSTVAAVMFVLLPNQSETVAWITGRVDSIPAFFYLASFLAYVRWRGGGRPSLYAWSLVWCFVALFSKQNTITLAPALALYDLIVERRRPAITWGWVRPYVPFGVLTAVYLALRYQLFGEVARETSLTAEQFQHFMQHAVRHAMRIVFGAETWNGIGTWAVAIATVAFAAARIVARTHDGPARVSALRPAIYFGVVWLALGLAPTIVSSYSSPRHAYLASAGWALTVGIAFDLIWRPQAARLQRATAAAAIAALVIAYSFQLVPLVLDWDARAALSSQAVAELEREAAAAPEGALIVAGVPARSWAFALPFAAQPPFTRSYLTARVSIVSDSSLHCCPAYQWDAYTRGELLKWLERSGHPPVIAMYWDPRTGTLLRLTDRDDPSLRTVIKLLLGTADRAALDINIGRLFTDLVALNSRTAR